MLKVGLAQYFFLFGIVLSVQVNAQITADFTSDTTKGCAPLRLNFADLSQSNSPIVYRYWDFGNSGFSNSNDSTPSRLYTTPGIYTVTLEVSNGVDTGKITRTSYVEVFAKPKPDFTFAKQNLCLPVAVKFTNTSSSSAGIQSYDWDFGDLSGQSNLRNPTYTYGNAGQFTVTLTATDSNGCKEIEQKVKAVNINVAKANFVANGARGACNPPLTVGFTNNSSGVGLSYQWDFGNNTTSTQKNPSVTYTQKGSYSVRLIVTDTNGCKDTLAYPGYVSIGQTEAKFELSDDSVCISDRVTLTSKSVGARSLKWTVGNKTLSGPTVYYYPPKCGSFDVTLVASSGSSCIDTLKKKLFVECVTADYYITQDSLPCAPEVVTFHDTSSSNVVKWDWRSGDGNFWNGKPINKGNPGNPFIYTFPKSPCSKKQYYDTLYVETKLGCRDTSIKFGQYSIENINVNSSVRANGPCVPSTVIHNASGCGPFPIKKWFWNYETSINDTASGLNPNTTRTYTNPGSYSGYVVIKDSAGCVDTSKFDIGLGTKQQADFSVSKDSVCYREKVLLTDSSVDQSLIDERYWYVGKELLLGKNPTWTATGDTGFFDVMLVVLNNKCPDTLIKPQEIYVSGPKANPGYSVDCNNPREFQFQSNLEGYTRFFWDFGDTSSIDSTNLNPTKLFSDSGRYSVTFFAVNDSTGCEYADTIEVSVSQLNANISASHTSGCAPLKVKFSTGGSSGNYGWYFGNGESDFFTNSPDTVEYETPGVYDVILVEQGTNKCRDTAYTTITVHGVNAGLQLPYEQCHLDTLQYTNLSSPDSLIYRYTWKLDSAVFDTVRNPIHILKYNDTINLLTSKRTLSDTMELRYLVEDSLGCQDSVVLPVVVNKIRLSLFASDSLLCFDDQVTFIDTFFRPFEPYAIIYDFGNGVTTDYPNPVHRFNHGVGHYPIKYTVTDSNGCSTTDTNRWVYIEAVRSVNFGVNKRDTNCYPAALFFSDSSDGDSIVKRYWDFGDGLGVLNTSKKDSILKLFTRPGRYTVKLKAETSNGCVDSTIKNGYIDISGPYAVFEFPDTSCIYESLVIQVDSVTGVSEFELDFGDGIVETYSDTLRSTSHIYNQVGLTKAIFVFRDSNRTCEQIYSQDVYIDEAIASYDVLGSDTGCVPLTVQFTNTSARTAGVNWTFGNGQSSTQLNESAEYKNPGIYDVTMVLTNDFGCKDTAVSTTQVFKNPEVNATGDTIVCLGDSLLLQANGATFYRWFPASEVVPNDSSKVWATPSNSMQYHVIGTDTNGCADSAQTWLDIQEHPIIQSLNDTTLIIGESLTPSYSVNQTNLTYTWSPADLVSCSDCEFPQLSNLTENAVVTLVISDSLGCFEVSHSFHIRVEEKYSISLPETFTPNGDGNNDRIYIRGWGIESLRSFEIYNRWGELVYQSTDLNEGWDGRYKGKPQNADTYVYKATVLSYDGEERSITGYITLLR